MLSSCTTIPSLAVKIFAEKVTVIRDVVMPECGGTPFRHIFLSRNSAPVNIAYQSQNADTAAFRQINSYYKKVTLYTKFGQLVLRSIEIVATRSHILRLKCTKFDSAGLRPTPSWGSLQCSPRPPSWI